jgi:hypothetical protein
VRWYAKKCTFEQPFIMVSGRKFKLMRDQLVNRLG